MSSKKSAVFRGIAAILAFLMPVSMTLATLAFQYDAWLNNNIFGINTSYVVGGSSDAAIYYPNDYGYPECFRLYQRMSSIKQCSACSLGRRGHWTRKMLPSRR